jgi:hypothetical protein
MTTTTLQHVYQEHRVSLAVEDGPILRKRYGKRDYRVVWLNLTYKRTDDEPWRITTIDLRGPFVKKDGSDGADVNHDDYWNASDLADQSWVVAAIDANAPGGTR